MASKSLENLELTTAQFHFELTKVVLCAGPS